MENYYTSIIMDNLVHLANSFELTDDFYNELVHTRLFPLPYVDYLKRMTTVDPITKKKNFLIDVTKRGSLSFHILMKIFNDQFQCQLLDKLLMQNCYPNSRPGFCLIINNELFVTKQSRQGSQRDVERLEKTFQEQFDYRVDVYRDQTRDQLFDLLDRMAKDDRLEMEDMFVLFIMSHGVSSQGLPSVMTSDELMVSYNDIIRPFSDAQCPRLANKPKIFIFNCCREPNPVSDVNNDPIPEIKDAYIIFSTLDSKLSYRHEEDGTLFINAFLKALEKDTELGQIVKDTQKFLNFSENEEYNVWQGVEVRNYAISKSIYLGKRT